MPTTTDKLMLDQVIDAIFDGSLDTSLDQIIAACRDRQKQQAAGLRFKVKKGDRVKVVTRGRIRPAYLDGLTAVVEKVNQTTLTIQFEDLEAAGRFQRGCRVPLEFVERIEAD